MNIAGIDYGSKLAGTTVIAHLNENSVSFFKSEKKKDADVFLKKHFGLLKLSTIFIDAPLSLPGVYTDLSYQDYFYRKADKELKGMSPMFLGGLTARAMKLQAECRGNDIELIEVYPSAMARHLELKQFDYKKEKKQIPIVLAYLQKKLPFTFDPLLLITWHHVDALLALYSAWRYQHNEHLSYGDPNEGIIIV